MRKYLVRVGNTYPKARSCPNGRQHTYTTTPSLLRAAHTTVFIHSVLASKLSLALKVAGKVTDSDTDLVFCLMYSILRSLIFQICAAIYQLHLHMVFTSRN